MAKNIGASCRMCRREAMKLFLKGNRCYTAKCPVETGRAAPGMHGQRHRKLSDYGVQLREKQRLRRYYGMMEGQFRLFFERAAHRRGVTGEVLLQMMEMRLDNLIYRLGFAPSRHAARQFVSHRHVLVNGRIVNVPSIRLKIGDTLEIRDKKDVRERAKEIMDAAESRGIVPWLSLDKSKFKGEILRLPTRDEIAPAMNEQLVVELYSK